ncbi:MAG: HAD-IIB family hydrolase [Clostridiales bacterium]|nr:HAD-IIB family hydrolase [Clostridiales bacterium]
MRKRKEKIIRTLYVTDLDGTLLGNDSRFSTESCEILQSMIDDGMHFTIATGRMHDDALNAIKPLKVNLPIISNNGVFIYDAERKTFLKKDFIKPANVQKVIDTAQDTGVMPYVCTLNDSHIKIYHSHIINKAAMQFYEYRKSVNDMFVEDVAYVKYKDEDVFYISLQVPCKKASQFYKDLNCIDGLYIEHYTSDHYPDYMWFEVLPMQSGKGYALDILKQIIKPQRVVCFGDFVNDIGMFKTADYSVATSNAVYEVKKLADEIIGHCDDESVVEFIKKDFEKEKEVDY